MRRRRGKKGGAREDDETVSTGCDAAVTYGGGGLDILAPGLQFLPLALFWATHRVSCSVTSVVARWAVLRG